ncbi:MAG: phosphoglycerate mutase family protein [Pseudomonadota bacterium]
MTRIFLIRHGEPSAPWHAEDDPGLSALGKAQAEAAAERLRALGLARIVTSPMRRCRETAAPFMAAMGLDAAIEPRVTEVPTPAGTDRQVWLKANFPGAAGGEPKGWDFCEPAVGAWRADVMSALTAIEHDTAVFTHFVAINAAVGAATNAAHAMVCKPAHASITEIVCERGVLRLVAMGEEADGRKIA